MKTGIHKRIRRKAKEEWLVENNKNCQRLY